MNKRSESAFRRLASGRRSVRDFATTEVPTEILHEIIDEALLAPSWSDTRPFRVAIATGKTRQHISGRLVATSAQIGRLRSSLLRQRLVGRVLALGRYRSDVKVPRRYPSDLRPRQYALAKALYGHLGIARMDLAGRQAFTRRNFEFFGAPAVLFIFARSGMGVYSALDAGHFMYALMLAAQSRGLATCAQGSLALWSAPVHDEFEVPPGYDLICGLSIGFAKEGSHINEFQHPPVDGSEITLRARSTSKAE